jgi:signal transduction histidine kinase
VATTDPTPEVGNEGFAAPLKYADVRLRLNTVRALGALAIAAASLLAYAAGVDSAAVWVVCGLLITADGLYRRHHGTSPMAPLVVGIFAVGTALVVSGHSPAIEVATFVYVVAVSMLLLPLPKAAVTIALSAAFVIPVAVVGTLADAGTADEARAVFHEGVIALVFTAILAILLVTAGRSLHQAIEHQRQALEAERRAGELKNEFVSMVSHELRTPLTSIAGFTDTLRESWTSFGPAEIDEFLLIMRRETEHLRDLLEDILVIPRLEAGQLRIDLTELDLRTAVFDSGDAVFTEAGTEFVVTIPGGVTVVADRVRLNQVLRNLLENSRKYGGDQVLVDGDRDGDLLRVTISDNGPGIASEDAERIFDHFEQLTTGDSRSSSGVGLGLPIARKLVGVMGGTLWYEPRFPIGSRFCFTLPMTRVPEPNEREAHPQAIA